MPSSYTSACCCTYRKHMMSDVPGKASLLGRRKKLACTDPSGSTRQQYRLFLLYRKGRTQPGLHANSRLQCSHQAERISCPAVEIPSVTDIRFISKTGHSRVASLSPPTVHWDAHSLPCAWKFANSRPLVLPCILPSLRHLLSRRAPLPIVM